MYYPCSSCAAKYHKSCFDAWTAKKMTEGKDTPSLKTCWSCPSCENAISSQPNSSETNRFTKDLDSIDRRLPMSIRDYARVKQIMRGEVPRNAVYRSMGIAYVKRKTGIIVEIDERVSSDRADLVDPVLVPRSYSRGFSVSEAEALKRSRPCTIQKNRSKRKKAKRERKTRRPLSKSPSDIPSPNTQIKILQKNPKRQKSALRYEQYKKAKTVGEYFSMGGSRADFRFDVARGFVTVLQIPTPIPETGDAEESARGSS